MTTSTPHPPAAAAPRHIGILLFDGVEELDAVGPWEVLAWWTRSFPEDGYTASTFSTDGRAVTCNKGLVIQPHHARETVPDLAVLVHPGGDTRALSADQEHLAWLGKQRETVPLLTSVCTGSLATPTRVSSAIARPRRTGEPSTASPRTTRPSRCAPTHAGSTTETSSRPPA